MGILSTYHYCVYTRSRDLVVLAAFTLLLHLPFIGRAIHFDEVQYLDTAANVFDHPLTPTNFTFIFTGIRADMAGHPHPPLNAYMLAALWAIRGHVAPLFFHAMYLVFPLIIAMSAYAIAARYTKRPLWVALIVSASPVVMVHGNSLDCDTPALAFLLSGAACFLGRRYWPAAVLFSLAGFTALQSFAVIGILLLDYLWRERRSARIAPIAAALTPFIALALWQIAQTILIGRTPAGKLAEYMTFPAFSTLIGKRNSAIVLVEHLGLLVVFAPVRLALRQWIAPFLLATPTLLIAQDYPVWQRIALFACVMLGVATVIWIAQRIREQPLLALWCLGYLLFASIIFFAGAARYLMPLTVPLAILFVLQNESQTWRLAATLAIGLFLGANLSYADYDLARLYSQVQPPPGSSPSSHDFLVNGEWGFRYYLTRAGGEMIEPSSPARAGRWIVTSELAVGANFGSPAESLAIPVSSRELVARTPFRVVDRDAHSGFETSGAGLLPFSFSRRPIDRIHYALDSPFLNVLQWTPTRFDDELVFLAPPSTDVRVATDPSWKTCQMRLFAQDPGEVIFSVRRSAEKGGLLWFTSALEKRNPTNPAEFALSGDHELVFSVEATQGSRVGWGDLICY